MMNRLQPNEQKPTCVLQRRLALWGSILFLFVSLTGCTSGRKLHTDVASNTMAVNSVTSSNFSQEQTEEQTKQTTMSQTLPTVESLAPTMPSTQSPTQAPTMPPTQAPTQAPTTKPSPTATPTVKPPSPTASPEPVMDLKSFLTIVNPYVPYDHAQMTEDAIQLAKQYPDWIQIESAGKSVLGRDLTLIKLGTGKKNILWCGSHHAREYISTTALMVMVEAYAKLAEGNEIHTNRDVHALLEQVTVWVVPMVNPDGVELAIHGLEAFPPETAATVSSMKMLRNTYSEWKSNINGVDLNRQYPVFWDEKGDTAGEPASELYKGTSAASEPEVQAMMALCAQQDFITASSFHTKGEVLYWADRGTVDKIPEAKALATAICKITGYKKMPVSERPEDYAAGFENWFRAEYERPAFCVELTPSNGNDRPHDNRKFDQLVWKKVHALGLYLMASAIQ